MHTLFLTLDVLAKDVRRVKREQELQQDIAKNYIEKVRSTK